MKKLDEMKRLKLLKIEEKGFYLMFYGLVFVIVVQAFLNDFKDIQEVILPIVLLVTVSIYFIIVCFKEGIWSYQDVNQKKSIVVSIFVGIVGAFIFGYKLYLLNRLHVGYLLMIFLIVTILMYLVLTGVNRIYVKRVERLEDGDEE